MSLMGKSNKFKCSVHYFIRVTFNEKYFGYFEKYIWKIFWKIYLENVMVSDWTKFCWSSSPAWYFCCLKKLSAEGISSTLEFSDVLSQDSWQIHKVTVWCKIKATKHMLWTLGHFSENFCRFKQLLKRNVNWYGLMLYPKKS